MVGSKRSNIPLYVQVAASLRTEMDAGMWPVGSKLPALEDLAERFGIAVQTMRQAVSTLEEEGLVLRRQGVGTIVQKEPREQRWLKLPTDWESLVGMLDNLEARITLVEASDRMPRIRDDEGDAASAYKFLKRVHYRNDEPFCVIEFYLSAEIYMRAPKQFRTKIAVPILNKMECVSIDKVTQSIRIDVADVDTAKLLDIPLAGPIAKARRLIVNDTGTVIYVADILYRGDVIHLDMDISPTERT